MSQRLISLSTELKKLRDEEYGVDVVAGCLLVHRVPYVTRCKDIAHGVLVVKLNLASDDTLGSVNDHVAFFSGDMPCDADGAVMEYLAVDHNEVELGGIKVRHRFSRHPVGRQYIDYHELVTNYVGLISGAAESLQPNVTARSYPLIAEGNEDSVFEYTDTASSRAEIDIVSRKLAVGPIAIVGLGGTGSYVLDFVAKTCVAEIHLFDGDKFCQHNAFRCPGAPSKDELKAEPRKVHYLRDHYANMRRNIIAHDCFIDETNVDELSKMTFAFICIDKAPAKEALLTKLEDCGIPFVDVGIGINVVDEKLTGQVRTTTSTPCNRLVARENIPVHGGEENNEYATNIQIAELNALNAALAVIKWKKLVGFYGDVENEFSATYKVSSNRILNDVV